MDSETTEMDAVPGTTARLDYCSNSALSRLGSFGVFLVLCGFVASVGLVAATRRSALPDVSWNLYVSARVLQGARLAVDCIEVNPPLITWLGTIPIVFGRFVGISTHQMMLILLTVVYACNLIACDRVLQKLSNLPLISRRAFILAASFAVFMLPGLNFTQREHLAFVLTLPWVCLAIIRASDGAISRTSAVAVGVAGAIGFSLKPYFLLAWILIEAYLIYIRGWRVLRRTELVVLVIIGTFYVMMIGLLTPDYFPMALTLRAVYLAYLNNGIYGTLMLGLHTWLPWFLFVALAHWHCDKRTDHMRAILTAAAIGFFIGAILQEKGLEYHFVTAVGFGFLLATVVSLRSAGRLPWYPSSVVVQLGWLVIPVVALSVSVATIAEVFAVDREQYNADPHLDLLAPVVRRVAGGEPVMVFSSNPASAWPLIMNANVQWASRYMSLWPLAGLYHSQLGPDHRGPVMFRPLAKRFGFERQFQDAVIDDLERYRPKLLLVLESNDSVQGFGGAANIDYLVYFREDPRFVRFLSEYEDIGNVGLYRFYRRRL